MAVAEIITVGRRAHIHFSMTLCLPFDMFVISDFVQIFGN